MQLPRLAIWTVAPLVLSAAIVGPAAMADNPVVDAGLGNQQRGIQWLYWSPLCVEEVITPVSGNYRYSYGFENVDTAHLWHFVVCAPFGALQTPTPFAEHPLWMAGYIHLNDVHEAYDIRNLDPSLQFAMNTWGPDWPNTTDPISPGDTVTGFSFIAPVHDDGPKYYFYETIESGWARETGYVAAVGQTCGGSTAVERGTWGALKAIYRH